MYSINFSTVDKRKRQKVTELNKFRTRPKKGVLFPEFDRVKAFLSLPRLHIRMCIIFNFKKQTNKPKKQKQSKNTKKQKKLNKKREYLQKKKTFAVARVKIFLATRISGHKCIFVVVVVFLAEYVSGK